MVLSPVKESRARKMTGIVISPFFGRRNKCQTLTLFFLLIFIDYNCFIMLCQFLPYNKVNQTVMHISLIF